MLFVQKVSITQMHTLNREEQRLELIVEVPSNRTPAAVGLAWTGIPRPQAVIGPGRNTETEAWMGVIRFLSTLALGSRPEKIWRRRQLGRKNAQFCRLCVEPLETRMMPAGTWQPLAHYQSRIRPDRHGHRAVALRRYADDSAEDYESEQCLVPANAGRDR